MCLYPTGILSLSLNSNAAITFFISFSIASRQKSVPVFASIASASLTDLGNSMPYLWVFFQYRDATFPIMRSRRRKTFCTHQAKAGSETSLLAFAYSARSTGFESFRSFSGNHDEVPSFHSTSTSQPRVVFLGYFRPPLPIKKPSSIDKACPFLRWSTISLRIA